MKLFSSKTAAFLLLFAAACNPSPRGIIIACVGDSLTESTYPRHLAKTLADEGIRSKILNYGRSGFSSGEYLSYLEENQAVLAAERPDYVLVQLEQTMSGWIMTEPPKNSSRRICKTF